MNKAALLLLPNLIGEHRYHQLFLPASVDKAMAEIDGLIAESEQGGRRFLGRFATKKPSIEIPIALLNEHTSQSDFDFLLEPIKKNKERWGLLSDAGLPCIADPGSNLVRHARKSGIHIQAFVGPSSILMALMLSGFSGQQFTFHAYLDKDSTKRKSQLLFMQKTVLQTGYTQIFMETPYRNQHLLNLIMETLADETNLSVAWDLTMQSQGILTQSIAIWKKSPLPNLDKKNALFLIGV